MKKHQTAYCILLLLAAILFFVSNSRTSLILFAALVLMPIVSRLFLEYFARGLKISCEVPSTTETDAEICARLKINSKMRFVPGEITMTTVRYNRLFGEKESHEHIIDLSGSLDVIELKFKSGSCGNTEFKIESLVCHGFFHLVQRRLKYSYRCDIAVYPRNVDLTSSLKNLSYKEHDGISYDIYNRGNDPTEVLEIRDYRAGDNVKNIHWKLSAKQNKVLLKEFSRPNNLSTMVYCDTSFYSGGEMLPSRTVSCTIAAAAAISRSLISGGIEHSFVFMTADGLKAHSIESMSDHTNMLDDVICSALSDLPHPDSIAADITEFCGAVSKIIYVTSEYSSAKLRHMSENAVLSAVILSTENRASYDAGDGYEIVSLPLDKLYTQKHNLRL